MAGKGGAEPEEERERAMEAKLLAEIAEVEAKQAQVEARIRAARPLRPLRRRASFPPSAQLLSRGPRPPFTPPGAALGHFPNQSRAGSQAGHVEWGPEEDSQGSSKRTRRLRSTVAAVLNADKEEGLYHGYEAPHAAPSELSPTAQDAMHAEEGRRSFRGSTATAAAPSAAAAGAGAGEGRGGNAVWQGRGSGASAAGEGESREEAVPPRPLQPADASTRKRNRKMFGALLLGTLEKFKEEDQRLQDSQSFARRSLMMHRAEQRAAEEREVLRLREREKQIEERRRDLILRARLAAKAEEKDVQLMWLKWRRHHASLASYFRTRAKPCLFFCPVADSSELEHLKQVQQQHLAEWESATKADIEHFTDSNLAARLAAVEAQMQPMLSAQRDALSGAGGREGGGGEGREGEGKCMQQEDGGRAQGAAAEEEEGTEGPLMGPGAEEEGDKETLLRGSTEDEGPRDGRAEEGDAEDTGEAEDGAEQ